MGIRVDISTTQDQYIAGGVVHGAVNVTCDEGGGTAADQKSAEAPLLGDTASYADTLVITFVGKIKAFAVQSSNSNSMGGYASGDNDDKKIISYDMQLASFDGKVPVGTSSFPFSVVLPEDLPPSMKRIDREGAFAIKYAFQGRIDRPGEPNLDAKSTALIQVFVQPEIGSDAAIVVRPQTEKITKYGLFGSGSMSIGLKTDRSTLSSNGFMEVTVVIRNNSSAKVKAMHLNINEESAWYPAGGKGEMQKTIGSALVTGSQLNELLVGGSDRRGRGSTTAEDTRQDIRDTIAAGGGMKFTISITDDDINSTIETDTVEVRHFLNVKLKTISGSSDPEVWTPIRVVQESPELLRTDPSGDNHTTLVSIPQSAVTMKFNNGRVDSAVPSRYGTQIVPPGTKV